MYALVEVTYFYRFFLQQLSEAWKVVHGYVIDRFWLFNDPWDPVFQTKLRLFGRSFCERIPPLDLFDLFLCQPVKPSGLSLVLSGLGPGLLLRALEKVSHGGLQITKSIFLPG